MREEEERQWRLGEEEQVRDEVITTEVPLSKAFNPHLLCLTANSSDCGLFSIQLRPDHPQQYSVTLSYWRLCHAGMGAPSAATLEDTGNRKKRHTALIKSN
ncbi:unnamed protein product [Pleuronectes platessa]|uniref:Uncharacterized protein n=1 Tax=Pleuronectes platessa TaxID=8262 RepID=A0A9N7TV45_PLEPL|nr:unnamed protein product [Pleuronectes platessa]